MNPAEFLYTHPVFSREDLAAAWAATRSRTSDTLSKLLPYWCASSQLRAQIQAQPMLQWKRRHVRRLKGWRAIDDRSDR